LVAVSLADAPNDLLGPEFLEVIGGASGAIVGFSLVARRPGSVAL